MLSKRCGNGGLTEQFVHIVPSRASRGLRARMCCPSVDARVRTRTFCDCAKAVEDGCRGEVGAAAGSRIVGASGTPGCGAGAGAGGGGGSLGRTPRMSALAVDGREGQFRSGGEVGLSGLLRPLCRGEAKWTRCAAGKASVRLRDGGCGRSGITPSVALPTDVSGGGAFRVTFTVCFERRAEEEVVAPRGDGGECSTGGASDHRRECAARCCALAVDEAKDSGIEFIRPLSLNDVQHRNQL